MPPSNKPTCEECAHAKDAGALQQRLCSRFPPRVFIVPTPSGPGPIAVSPVVNADFSCGEFAPRPINLQ